MLAAKQDFPSFTLLRGDPRRTLLTTLKPSHHCLHPIQPPPPSVAARWCATAMFRWLELDRLAEHHHLPVFGSGFAPSATLARQGQLRIG